jgi:flavin reductase (DIM6/NTAB) family NADH-FMN oxidoreductase RutF
MVVVAIPKGQPVEPLLINSRGFALCMIESDDRLLLRKFAQTPDRADDPFVAISSCDAPSGSPIIDRAICYIDCEVARLVELESDHRLCVGLVHAAGMLHPDHGDRMNGQPG